MRAVYLSANQCYGVLLGDSLVSIGPEPRILFPKKSDLRTALKRCGLKLQRDRVVADPNEFRAEI